MPELAGKTAVVASSVRGAILAERIYVLSALAGGRTRQPDHLRARILKR